MARTALRAMAFAPPTCALARPTSPDGVPSVVVAALLCGAQNPPGPATTGWRRQRHITTETTLGIRFLARESRWRCRGRPLPAALAPPPAVREGHLRPARQSGYPCRIVVAVCGFRAPTEFLDMVPSTRCPPSLCRVPVGPVPRLRRYYEGTTTSRRASCSLMVSVTGPMRSSSFVLA